MFIKNALIIGAHFDDAELGAGGTAAKLVSEGANVFKVTLTNNEVDQSVFNMKTSGNESSIDSKKACAILGIHEIDMEGRELTCQLKYSKEMMQKLEKMILDYEIDTVFMHSEHDINQDHAAAGTLSKTAARHCKNLLVYQSNMYICAPQAYYPSIFFDISDYVDMKRKALLQYSVEHQRYASEGDSLFENNIYRNKEWGYTNGVRYAEGFIPYKMLF